jgi:hypothetical protein
MNGATRSGQVRGDHPHHRVDKVTQDQGTAEDTWRLAARAQQRADTARRRADGRRAGQQSGRAGSARSIMGYSNWAGPMAATCGSTLLVCGLRTAIAYAPELVGLAPEVILASASASVAALQQASRSAPIVFANVIDPVGRPLLTTPSGSLAGSTAYRRPS